MLSDLGVEKEDVMDVSDLGHAALGIMVASGSRHSWYIQRKKKKASPSCIEISPPFLLPDFSSRRVLSYSFKERSLTNITRTRLVGCTGVVLFSCLQSESNSGRHQIPKGADCVSQSSARVKVSVAWLSKNGIGHPHIRMSRWTVRVKEIR